MNVVPGCLTKFVTIRTADVADWKRLSDVAGGVALCMLKPGQDEDAAAKEANVYKFRCKFQKTV